MEVMTVLYIKLLALLILFVGVWFEVNYKYNKKRIDLLFAVFLIVLSVCIWVFPSATAIVKIFQAG